MLDPVGVDPQRDDAAAALELDAVEHQRCQTQVLQRSAHELDQVLARARDELARDRRLRRRARLLVDLGPDRLAGLLIAARRDTGEHPLEHDLAERVTVGEVPVARKRQLVLVVCGPDAWTADRHAPATERHLTVVVAMADRPTLRIMLALRAHDLVDLGLHDLVQHAETNADAQRQQALLRGAGQLAERLLHALGQRARRLLLGGDLVTRYGPHRGGFSCPRWTCSTRHARNTSGRGGKTAASSSTDYGTTSRLPRTTGGSGDGTSMPACATSSSTSSSSRA